MQIKAGPIAILFKALLTLLYGLPLVWIFMTSFKSSADVMKSENFFFRPVITAYVEAMNTQLVDALIQSVIIASGTTLLVLCIAIPAAYGLARSSGTITTLVLGLLIVFQMMPQTATVIPLFQVFSKWFLLDSTFGVIIADTALLTPFAVILLRPFFRSVPPQLEEAASIDGSGLLRTFFQISLPIARNGIATAGTLIFLLAWGEFLFAVNFFLTPGNYPLSALLSQQVSAFGINWPGLMALAVLTSIPILIVFASTYRLLKDGLTVGAVK